jgi:uncharacterized protein YndB with AHSA1/START domain
MTNETAANEIRIIRVYNAPVSAVWSAWVEPAQVEQWWGPRGFTLTTHHKHVQTGGTWDYVMHGPDGKDYENNTVFHEVVDHVRMVYDHGANADQPPLFRVTALFSEAGGKTTLDMRMQFPSAEAAAQSRIFIKAAGGETTWDRLGEYLEQRLHGEECFFINRSFEAPIDTLYQLWTEPRLFEQWLAPTGSTMQFLREGVAAGKSSFYCMQSAAGKMYGRANYLELVRPSRLLYTQQFCDEHEGVTRHPMAPTWPETMLTQVEFTPETSRKTRITIRWAPTGKVTPEELATFVSARAGMSQGWTGSLDKLEELLGSHDAAISTPRLAQTPSGSVAFIHLQIAKHEIQQAMGPGIQEIFAAIKTQSAQVTGPWFTVHHSLKADSWDFDICVPIQAALEPVGRVQHKQRAPSKAITCSYFGGYEGLHNGWSALRTWTQAQKYNRAGWICEVYEVGPESGLPADQWRTQLYQPITD